MYYLINILIVNNLVNIYVNIIVKYYIFVQLLIKKKQ